MSGSRGWVGWAPVVLACAAASASADPRWWWSDVRVTSTPTASLTPHLVAPSYASGSPLGTVFLTWAEVDPLGGDTEIWAIATFDGGCTFCEAVRLTDNDVEDVLPRIAVLALPEGIYSIQVIFDSAGTVVVAWDSTTVEFRVPFDQLCAQWRDLGDEIRAGSKYALLEAAIPGSTPDIAAIGSFAFGHFHAVWKSGGGPGGTGDVHHARDLTARGVGWFLDPVKELTPGGAASAQQPVLALDLLTDPDPISGLHTMDRTAISVAFLDGTPPDTVLGLRSVDSGSTFSPSGVRADAPAGPISEPLQPGGRLDAPAIDAAGNLFSFTLPAWVAATWDAAPAGVEPDLRSNFRRLTDPVTPAPDWLSPEVSVTAPAPSSTLNRSSLALQPLFANDEVPAWASFETDAFGAPEIGYRAGLLGLGPAFPDWSRHPIPPARPWDSALSTDRQLSHCAWNDDVPLACEPSRRSGGASDAELAGDFLAVYATWSDTRDGNAEIYFKRTDTFISSVSASAAADCSRDGTAFVDVTFDQLQSCPAPFSGERMARYLVYHGATSGGPYANADSPLVVEHDAGLGPTRIARITGLAPGATWHVVVVPEDEARNVQPGNFDPTIAAAFRPPGELEVVLPGPCAVTGPCLYRFDLASLDPLLPAHAGTYLVPRTVDDIALQGPAYRCPFASGELEPDGNALGNGVVLALYQVDLLTESLRLAKSGPTIVFTF